MIPTIENETGQYLLSHYGHTYALAFKGDADFIERSYNFAYNFCATNGSLIELGIDMHYILTTPEKLLKALALYYYNQIIRDKEIEVKHDPENGEVIINEEEAEALSAKKAQTFYDNNIIKENFMFNTYLDRVKQISPLAD